MYTICTTAQCFSHISQLVQVLGLLALNLQVLPNIQHQIPVAVECPILTWQIPKTITQSRKKSQMGHSYSIPFNSNFLRWCSPLLSPWLLKIQFVVGELGATTTHVNKSSLNNWTDFTVSIHWGISNWKYENL
jgi:hypothetical protein